MLASQVGKPDQTSYYTTMQKGNVFLVYIYYYTKLEKAWNTKEKRRPIELEMILLVVVWN